MKADLSPVPSRTPRSSSFFLNFMCCLPGETFAHMEMPKKAEMLAARFAHT